jgi:hypothetical protein
VDFLQELKTFQSEDLLHSYTAGGGPLVQLGADDDVVGCTSDDLFSLDLVFRDALLHDVGDAVEGSVDFGLHHEDVTATQYVTRRHVRATQYVHSETKSMRIWDLMACCGQNSRSNSPSSTDHLTIRPTVSRLRRISPRGKLETTLILCDWK